MLNENNIRELAYVVQIDEVRPIPNYDRVEYARVGGWWVIVRKDQFKVGDPAIYIEVDSKVPETEPFLFLEKRHFKVKTLKMCGVISQGLLMEPADFNWREGDFGIGEFVTERLGIVYADPEDNKRKAPSEDKYKKMKARHPKLFRNKFVKWLMKYELGRKVMFVFFGKKKDKKSSWPGHIASKTDVERIQNMIYVLNDKQPFVATEKIDGSSFSVMIERNKFGRIKKYVCSRNVVFDDPKAECYYDTNIYFEAYEKYNLGDKIERMLKDLNLSNLAIQMEIYGDKVQRRNYSLKNGERKIAIFHILSNNIKMPMNKVVELCEKYDLPHVPILNDNYVLPDTIEELQNYVEGEMSKIDGLEKEGIVFYDKATGAQYFKFVSPNFLMKYHG